MASRTPARVTFRWLLEVNKVATSGPEGKIRQVNAIAGRFWCHGYVEVFRLG